MKPLTKPMIKRVRELALIAAGQAAKGCASLVMVARGGPQHFRSVFEDDTIEQLADATKIAIELEAKAGHKIDAEREQLHAALCRYLEGWA